MRADEVHLTAYGQPATDDEDSPPTLVTVPEGLVDEVSAALPGAEVHRLTAVGAPDAPASTRWTSSEVAPGQPASGGGPGLLSGGPFGILAVVADDTVLGLYDLPPAALRVLTDEGIVGIGENGSASFTTDLTLVADRVDEAVDGARPPIDELLPPVSLTVVAPGDLALGSLGGVFMTVERARALGLEAVPGPTVVRATEALTDDQRTIVQDIAEEHHDLQLDAPPGGGGVSVNQQVLYPAFTIEPAGRGGAQRLRPRTEPVRDRRQPRPGCVRDARRARRAGRGRGRALDHATDQRPQGAAAQRARCRAGRAGRLPTRCGVHGGEQ